MIILKKDGIYLKDWSTKKRDYKQIKVHSFIPYLEHHFSIEDGATFGDFMKYLFKQVDEYSYIFSTQMGGFHLKHWKKEFESLAKIPDEVYCLSIGWSAEYTDWSKRVGKHNFFGHEYEITRTDKELEIYADFSGLGKVKKDDTKEDSDLVNIKYAVEYTPLYELKSLPLQIDNRIIIRGHDWKKILVDANMEMSVYQAIGAVLDEITFAGTPEMREEQFAEIKQTAQEAEEYLKNNPDALKKHL